MSTSTSSAMKRRTEVEERNGRVFDYCAAQSARNRGGHEPGKVLQQQETREKWQ